MTAEIEHEEAFREWIRTLDQDVIHGEFGYVSGEFTVYPECWIEDYAKGMTPHAAFQRMLDCAGQRRDEAARARKENYARIVAEESRLS